MLYVDDAEVIPVALTDDASLLIIHVSYLKADYEATFVNSFIAVDAVDGKVVGTVGQTFVEQGQFLVECVQSSTMVLITYSPPEDQSGMKISLSVLAVKIRCICAHISLASVRHLVEDVILSDEQSKY